METKLLIALILLFLPSLIWLVLKQAYSPWWLENASATPVIILFFCLTLMLVFNSFMSLPQCISYFFINIVLVILLNNSISLNDKVCLESINIFQFNIKYIEGENELSELINYLIAEPYHLITLQGVSQQSKSHIITRLSPYYPNFIRGESAEIGRKQVVSDQLLFSRYAFNNIQYFINDSSAFLISSQWQLPSREINLLSLHPPSPRNEKLWQIRNKTLYQLHHIRNNFSVKNSIVIGDLNLSKHSSRLNSLRRGMNTRFINSWPNKYYASNLFSLALDHFWVSKPAMICARQRIDNFNWSDHFAIKTQVYFR